MKRLHFARALCLALSLAPLPALAQTAPSAAADASSTPDAKQEAARRFEHAIKLYEDADYALALAEFERVYELVPDYRVLYNIGQVNMQLGRYARARRALAEYVLRGGSELAPDRRSAVQADLDLLEGRTASIALDVEPAGAEVSIDGVAVGQAPLAEPLVVDVGERTVQVRLVGYAPRSQILTLAGGDRRKLALTLNPEPAPAAPSAQKASAPPKIAAAVKPAEVQSPSLLWAGWSATAVLAAASAGSAVLGASAASELRSLRDSPNATREGLDAAHDRAKLRLLLADGFGALALATGATTLYFQLSGPHGTQPSRDSARLHLAVSPNSVALRFEQ